MAIEYTPPSAAKFLLDRKTDPARADVTREVTEYKERLIKDTGQEWYSPVYALAHMLRSVVRESLKARERTMYEPLGGAITPDPQGPLFQTYIRRSQSDLAILVVTAGAICIEQSLINKVFSKTEFLTEINLGLRESAIHTLQANPNLSTTETISLEKHVRMLQAARRNRSLSDNLRDPLLRPDMLTALLNKNILGINQFYRSAVNEWEAIAELIMVPIPGAGSSSKI